MISTETTRNYGTGNGATLDYDFTFKIFSFADLSVYVRIDDADVLLTLDVDYTIDGVADDAGGTITLIDASQIWMDSNSFLASGVRIVMIRSRDFTQDTDIRNQSSYYPEGHENAFDKAAMLAQQNHEELSRVPMLGITELVAGIDMTLPAPIGTHLIGWNGAGTALTSYSPDGVAAAAGGIVDTDDVNEGATNLYYTNARADARANIRIAAASITDLSDVTITTPATGQVLSYNGSVWVNSPASGGGGGTVVWSEQALAPNKTQLYGGEHYEFEDAVTQYLYTIIRVPSLYTAGNQIKIKATFFTPTTSGNVLVQSLATLIRVGTEAMSSTTNQRTSTNAAATVNGTANVPTSVTLDLTSATGTINSVAVSPGDYILVRVTRDTATDTLADIAYVTTDASEVTFV